MRWRHPDARAPWTERVHSARRGDRADRLARHLGPRGGLPAGSRVVGLGGVGRSLALTVNLSAQQLQEADFIERLAQILERTGLDPNQLVLEMTETVDLPRHDVDDRPARGNARARRADRDRRFRHGLLVARLPAPVPGRHPEDREGVHRPTGPAGRVAVRGRDRGPRAGPRDDHHRRGHRGARPARQAARARLPPRPGLPVLEAARSRRDPRVPGAWPGRCRPPPSPMRRLPAAPAARRSPGGAPEMFILYAIPVGILAGFRSVAGSSASARSSSGGPGCSCSDSPSSSSCSRTSSPSESAKRASRSTWGRRSPWPP